MAMISLLLATCLAGCAASKAALPPEEPPMHSITEFTDRRFAEVADPWERFNRNMYRFNYYFDNYVFLPVVHGYEFITPTIVQTGVTNFFSNIGEIRNLTNNMFQLKGKESLTSIGRFVTNSSIGLGGLFDPASSLGLERAGNDFGQTLGHYGTSSGPYLVLPFLGPSTLRDTGGLAIDAGVRYGIFTGIDPFGGINNGNYITLGQSSLEVIDLRHRENFRYYQNNYPFEYYMVRFFYHQKRDMDIKKGM
jgi:phospholipid-binding lipoprotein MlaA